jgi:hypothetical protein
VASVPQSIRFGESDPMSTRNHTTGPAGSDPNRAATRRVGWRTPGPMGPAPQTSRSNEAVPRVVVCENRRPGENPITAALRSQGVEAIACSDGATLLEQVMRAPADAVIFLLRPGNGSDLGVLELLRRTAPALPLVIIASSGSLDTQKLVQDLRPIYYAVWPVEGAELQGAVQAALARKGHTPA